MKMIIRAVRLSKFSVRFSKLQSISVWFRVTEPGPKPNQFWLTEPDLVNQNWFGYIVPPLVLAYLQLASKFYDFYPNINNLT